MKVCREIEIKDLEQILRCGAKDRWNDATDEQKELVWQVINDVFGSTGNIPTESEINDFIWFECDEIFFPEEYEEED